MQPPKTSLCVNKRRTLKESELATERLASFKDACSLSKTHRLFKHIISIILIFESTL